MTALPSFSRLMRVELVYQELTRELTSPRSMIPTGFPFQRRSRTRGVFENARATSIDIELVASATSPK